MGRFSSIQGGAKTFPKTEPEAVKVSTPVVVPVLGQGMQAAAEEYHADNKSFIGTCPDCGLQLEFSECG